MNNVAIDFIYVTGFTLFKILLIIRFVPTRIKPFQAYAEQVSHSNR